MIEAGIYHAVTFTKDPSDTRAALMTANTVQITWINQRELRPEVTPINSDVLKYAPDAETGILKLTGFIDAGVSPGLLNDIEATVVVYPSVNGANKYMSFPAWVQQSSWISGVDDANRFAAIVYPTGSLTYSWI